MKKWTWTIPLIVALTCGQTFAAEELSYSDLVYRLVDLERLAQPPLPGESCRQWSSYDRASTYDAETDRYLNWSANGDGTGLIRMEEGGQVLAEMEGPGVIWRIWSAHALQGHVRIYLDGQETPAVDLPFIGYFNGQNAPFNRPALVYVAGGGFNSYIPIPYQKSCKIVADEGWGRYYHFTYTTFPKGTKLPTFDRQLSKDARAALDHVNRLLSENKIEPYQGTETNTIEVTAPAGQSVPVIDLDGPRAIVGIEAALELPECPQDRRVLRELALRMTWDDADQPAVWSPLGDFFGTAPGVHPYRGLPLGVEKDRLYSRWYMPFAKHGLIELTNDGGRDRTVTFIVRHIPVKNNADNLLRFHARWHQGHEPSPQRPIDWPLLDVKGSGRFVGVSLFIWNPQGGWWGEGDEKFFVDGEKFPSTFGTGTEDYFGYAWCSNEIFSRPFHAQPLSVAMNPCAHPAMHESGGSTINNRWQIADNIPFHKSLQADVEKYFSNQRLTRYDCTVYWYQSEPHNPLSEPVALAQRNFERHEKDLALLNFLKETADRVDAQSVKKLIDVYEMLAGDPAYAGWKDRLTLCMARAESAADMKTVAQRRMEPLKVILTEPFVQRINADAIREIYGQLPQSPQGRRPMLVDSGDGSILRVRKGDRWCITTRHELGKTFIYFAFPEDSPARNFNGTARIKIDYYSDGQTDRPLQIHYDSELNPYHNAGQVSLNNESGWHSVVIDLPQARFSGRQNSKSDFRIWANSDQEIFIGDVLLMH